MNIIPGTRKTGVILLLSAELCFALSTVFAKLSAIKASIPGIEITFFRFLIGFIIILIMALINKESLIPVNKKNVITRAVFNIIAVLLFFTGVQFTTVTNANMLNMTYPVFVYIFTPFINKEKNPKIYFLFLFFTIIGIYLIINPEISGFRSGDIFALMSAVFAALAVSVLREARKSDSTFIILFYLMAVGTVVNLFLLLPFFVMPEGIAALYVLLGALTGVLGQVFITAGYRYIEAAPGSIVSSSRLIFAVILGVSIFSDPLTVAILTGCLLIIISLAGVSGIWKRNNGNAD